MYTIYGIRFHKTGHRYDGRIRYVGLTMKPISERLAEHVKDARLGGTRALMASIRKHGKAAFSVEALAACATRAEANALEQAMISSRCVLISDKRGGLNITTGGEGVDYTNAVVRARHLASLGDAWRDAQRARNINDDPLFVAAQRASLVTRWGKPSERKKQSEVMREARNRPEVAAGHSARTIARNKTPEARAMTAARNKTPEMRESSSRRAKAMNDKMRADPTIRIRMMITRNGQSLAHYEATHQPEKAAATRERIAALRLLIV